MAGQKKNSLKFPKEDHEEVENYLSSKAKSSNRDIINKLENGFRPNAKQIEFINTINNSTVIICSGAAGTGKSITAIYKGLSDSLRDNKKLILLRPIFESATQKLGALPGTIEEKLEPHIRSFMYILDELVGMNEAVELVKSNRIIFEVLNYLRGATLNNAVIICDEAQNMSLDEMILAVTRIGKNSKIIFTGDFYQSDLRGVKGSITEFAELIKNINGVNKFTFNNNDVVRNPILVEITKIWAEYKDELDKRKSK